MAEEVLQFLETRRGLLGGVVITGGEPLCQRALPDFMRCVRRMGFRLKLDTNGTHPERLRALLEAEDTRPDYAALDFKAPPEGYPALTGQDAGGRVLESLDVLRRSGIAFEVRTTVVRPMHTRDVLGEMAGFLRPEETWFLQRFRNSGAILAPTAGLSAPDAGELDKFARDVSSRLGIRLGIR